ncbi:hypothetical protein R3P38DRAFT_2790646 [Favolaschia claudopus]|uniref:Uncharacterized protein n=1 Tax=Favolaschia claudopus TaxID=2862362 RepID=A0AAW0AH93_9AGAR
MKAVLAQLDADSHLIRKRVAAQEQSDKQTAKVYARQWEANQASLLAQDPAHIGIPAFPVIPSKVAFLLQYDTTRPQKRKRTDGTDSTATVGSAVVRLVITALKNWRVSNQHRYPDVPDAQRGLQVDLHIKRFGSAAAHNEPQCAQMALKAKGTNADTFTSDDLKKCSMWGLTNATGPQNIYIAILLTSRGDNARHRLISDLFTTNVIMNAKGLGETVPCAGEGLQTIWPFSGSTVSRCTSSRIPYKAGLAASIYHPIFPVLTNPSTLDRIRIAY